MKHEPNRTSQNTQPKYKYKYKYKYKPINRLPKKQSESTYMPKKKTTNPKSVASKQSPQNPSASKPRGTGDHRRRQKVRQTVKNAYDQLGGC